MAVREQAQRVLRDYYGYDAFRPGQGEVIDAVLAGRDCVAVMPTGAGKSLCYQVPALVLAYAEQREVAEVPFRPAAQMTLVVSPLVSLMSDQVMALKNLGIPAAYLNSQLSPRQQDEVLSRARAGAYALMYVAPERLTDERFLNFVGANGSEGEPTPIPLALVAVDEAHCVSQWGQDFRPSYLGIADFIAKLPERPVVAAFTATATPRVADDIARLLQLRQPTRVTTGFDRPNLHFGVEQLTDKKKLARIAARALADSAESGIVYCSTRKDVERVHEALVAAGVRATRYHAGLSHIEREANQRAFVNDDAPVMVATNAFGMGIDKSNVRYVIHHNMPGSLEAYYQEAGRAGRDGEPSDCLLLWSDGDIATCRFFIEQETNNEALSPEEQQLVRASQRRRLAAMTNYCMTTDCLRATILRYFGEGAPHQAHGESCQPGRGERSVVHNGIAERHGETFELLGTVSGSIADALSDSSRRDPLPSEEARDVVPAAPGCGNCSNCEGGIDAVDVTKTARSVMRCVHELRGRFGKGIVCDVLCGSKSAKLREYGLTEKRTYGIVDDPAPTVKEIIELLTAGEYLEISEGRYPLVGLGPRAREAATDEFRLYMKRRRKQSPTSVHAGMRAVRGVAGPRAAGGADVADDAGLVGDVGASGRVRTLSGAKPNPSTLETDEQRALFERLRQLRKRLADEEGMPPYIVFSDASLRSMCVLLPTTPDEFLQVHGVGETKLKRYGEAFLEELSHREN